MEVSRSHFLLFACTLRWIDDQKVWESLHVCELSEFQLGFSDGSRCDKVHVVFIGFGYRSERVEQGRFESTRSRLFCRVEKDGRRVFAFENSVDIVWSEFED